MRPAIIQNELQFTNAKVSIREASGLALQHRSHDIALMLDMLHDRTLCTAEAPPDLVGVILQLINSHVPGSAIAGWC